MVIIVTHSLRYAQRNCDRLMWLHKGSVKEIGDPKEIIKKYRATAPPRPKRKKRSLELSKTETDVKDNVVIKAEDVGVYYKLNTGPFWALKNLNFEVKEGEVVGIIGHNGAGKSTLCKALTRILAPDEGTLTIKGETSSLLGYGTGFNHQLTGRDNIFLNAMLLGVPKQKVEDKYDEIVKFSGIRRAIDKPVKEYSSGMRSRLGFSIAAILKPDIFIIDEALSTVDLACRQKSTERIQEMMDHAKAVVIVTHSMNFVETVCTRGIWIEKGEIKYDGPAEEAVAKYREASGIEAKPKKKKVAKKKGTAKKKAATKGSGKKAVAKGKKKASEKVQGQGTAKANANPSDQKKGTGKKSLKQKPKGQDKEG